MLALKDLMAALGSPNLDCRQDGAKLDAARRDFYCFNTTIAGIEEADAILIIGTNPRREAPVLNARIRKRWLATGMPIGLIGAETDLTYPCTHLGTGPSVLRRCTTARTTSPRRCATRNSRWSSSGRARWPVPTAPRSSPPPGASPRRSAR